MTKELFPTEIQPSAPKHMTHMAGDILLWLQEEHVQQQGHDAYEQRFIADKLAQFSKKQPSLLRLHTADDISESIVTSGHSLREHGIFASLWRNTEDVWRMRMQLVEPWEEHVRINAILVPSGLDMDGFVFPPVPHTRDTHGFLLIKKDHIRIDHISENGASETEFYTPSASSLTGQNGKHFTVFLGFDHGPHYEANKYDVSLEIPRVLNRIGNVLFIAPGLR